jgi:hypothetical protein
MEEQRIWEVAWHGSWEVEVESDVAERELKSCVAELESPWRTPTRTMHGAEHFDLEKKSCSFSHSYCKVTLRLVKVTQ